MKKSLLLSTLGTLLTFFVSMIAMLVFNCLLYFGCNLVSFNLFKAKAFSFLKRPKKVKA